MPSRDFALYRAKVKYPETDPENFARMFNVSLAEPFTNGVFRFFLFFSLGISGPSRPKYPEKYKKIKHVSYTPGLGLCRDRFKGGTRDVEHRNSTCLLRRPEEVENKR